MQKDTEKKYTRKYRKAPKKYVYSKKSRKQGSRKYGRYIGGLNISNKDQIKDLW
jgi:hypothetical protein